MEQFWKWNRNNENLDFIKNIYGIKLEQHWKWNIDYLTVY